MDVATPRGLATVEVSEPSGPVRSLLALGHGAGGGVDAPDIRAVAKAALGQGVAVALVTQPYRVAGRRTPAPAGHLDEAWTAVIAALRSGPLGSVPLVVGGRSSGARVACRTAVASGATGIVALAFPLHPPGRPERTRDSELDTGISTLVINGDRDPFGVPAERPGVTVRVRAGLRHDLRGDLKGTAALVIDWMCQLGLAA
jgi:predicted alpha/beta-hydrolase family hydrolase